ncbi:unnamed protein product [Linum tenue]|uniref:Peptidase A1 domain-containing protein n=1 Tax=Linum tenue TaxID=586396 RepID=A0AAV0ID77_9ROSI|nr:unnamed protein product [Linum tenue]
MAPTTSYFSPSLFFFFFFFFLSFALTSSSSSHGSSTITTHLIHRDSTFSPSYDAAETVAGRAARAAEASLARHRYLSSLKEDMPRDVEAGLVLAATVNVFYVNFSIGDPPVQQLAVMDTGSSLTWVKCLPCSPCSPGGGAATALFDPAKSKSYYALPCTDDCKKCDAEHCMYTMSYLGNQTSEGVLASEQLTFLAPAGGGETQTAVVPSFVFGCCSSLTGVGSSVDPNFNGILALGSGHFSLVNQFGDKFSYCTGSIADRSYPHNRLSIGRGAYLAGDTARVSLRDGAYNVFVNGITLGGQEVFLKMSDITRGVFIDTGAELTFLYTEAYDAVKAEIIKLASGVLTGVNPTAPYELCYKGTVGQDTKGFPALGLQFAGGADLVADNNGMFKQVQDDVFCFAFVRSPAISVVGMMAQQGYNVGYDLDQGVIHFQSMDCEILPSS